MIVNPQQVISNDWTVVEPQSLLQLVGVRKTTDQFGVLLRHYWLPNTVLTYESALEQRMRDGSFVSQRQTITKRQVCCDADSCTWREKISGRNEAGLFRFDGSQSERFCTYNRSEQKFRTQPILGHTAWPEDDSEARAQAFLRQPVLLPLLPIPQGFRWHVEAESGFLEFTLESESRVGEMPIVTVRRWGEFWVNAYFTRGESHPVRLKLRREGITAYATERSVVLQDKVRDTVIEAEDRRLLGLEQKSRMNLTRSELTDGQVAPLYFQYRTDSGKKYLYDAGTGHIIRVNHPVFDTIIEDYRKLNPLEIYWKHTDIAPEQITESLCEIERHHGAGQLADRIPDELCHVDKIVYENEYRDLGEFWQGAGALLVLGITERCNLDCAYCCFSGKFVGQRTHSNRSMSFDVAKKAIVDYLEQESTNADNLYMLSFYGGEPLLERRLLVDCVEFAKKHAEPQGKKIRFAITTNGTLLDDATVDFLVENEFLTLISLDGPQMSHDRYRVFPNGKGSFETVYANLKRFVKRYPDYLKRGLSLTLAPPLDLDETAKFVDEVLLDFPLSRVAIVNTGPESLNDLATVTRYGCRTACSKSEMPLETFREYKVEDHIGLVSLEKECAENLATLGYVESKKSRPFSTCLIAGEVEKYHKRSVQPKPSEHLMFVPCLPGFTRRFCDVNGNYRVCERVDDSQAFRLGNVWTGLDVEKLERTLELRRHLGDCANCTSLKTCSLCYARIPNSDTVSDGFNQTFDLMCQTTRKADRRMFKVYTEIMDCNPKAFERSSSDVPPAAKSLYYATQINRLSDCTREKLCCEK